MMYLYSNDICDQELESLESGLVELGIAISAKWSKSRKALELNKASKQAKSFEIEPAKPKY